MFRPLNQPGHIKVPIVITIWFWIIKVLCTTVGESAADWLNETVGLGLGYTSLIMAAILIVSMAVQIYVEKYIPALYWWCVMLVSVVGTLVTDLLVDEAGVELWVCIVVFAVAMLGTFGIWYYMEKTLSIHSINTIKRELLYWSAILFTFALGTAAGDFIAEGLGLGYWGALGVFAAAVAFVAGVYYLHVFNVVHILNEVSTFWIVYVLTRPLGASLGDLLSSDEEDGLGLGPGITSAIFIVLIVAAVAYLEYSKVDVPKEVDEVIATEEKVKVNVLEKVASATDEEVVNVKETKKKVGSTNEEEDCNV